MEDSKIKVEREIVHEENISELEKRKVVDFLNKSFNLKYEEVRDKYYSPSTRIIGTRSKPGSVHFDIDQ